MSIQQWITEPESILYSLVVMAVAFGIAIIARFLYGFISRRALSRIPFWASVAKHTKRPITLLLFAIAVFVAPRFAALPDEIMEYFRHGTRVLFLASGTLFAMRAFSILEDSVLAKYRLDVPDNLKARKILTQLQMIRRLGSGISLVLGVGIILLSFEGVREIGTTILASAGVIGVVIGFAGQRTIGMIISGLQVAFTQPIRLDDAIIVENEWGRVEEITMTYVVVRIWDQRRLVLPITYFIEKPFQNWTRATSELLGTVFLYVDYTFPVDELRTVFQALLESSSLWDKRAWNVQVTNSTETTMELRCLMSAADSGSLWELRVEVREKLIAWISRRYPQMLPRARVVLKKSVPPNAAPS